MQKKHPESSHSGILSNEIISVFLCFIAISSSSKSSKVAFFLMKDRAAERL
ncbi:hypothetical protein JSO02_003149, partial [Listeria innocua]|nr:hypothetical protein [Listeria innocua]EHF3662724.1 hypothetical protein [Listeria innocua]